MHAVWPDMVGGEAVLTVAIRELRRALGDQARHPQFIDAEPVKVNIRPAHGDLEDTVQIAPMVWPLRTRRRRQIIGLMPSSQTRSW